MKFRAVVADPPWDFGGGCWDRQVSKADSHYDTLSLDDICALPVPSKDDAYLFLWTTSRHLINGSATKVAKSWGFRPLTTLVWVKPQLGLGYYVRNCHEHVVFGVRGSPGPFKDQSIRSDFTADRRRHSAKPQALYDIVERATDGPYLELFARAPREGWTVWGNEVGDSLGIGFDPKEW